MKHRRKGSGKLNAADARRRAAKKQANLFEEASREDNHEGEGAGAGEEGEGEEDEITIEDHFIQEEGNRQIIKILGKKSLDRITAFRMAVALVFANKYDSEPDESKWKGVNGTQAKIHTDLNIHERTDLDDIMRDHLQCARLGTKYRGESDMSNAGRKPILTTTSIEAQIVVDPTERGCSIPQACILVNQHRKDEGLPSCTESAVQGLIVRLKSKGATTKIQKFVARGLDGHCSLEFDWLFLHMMK